MPQSSAPASLVLLPGALGRFEGSGLAAERIALKRRVVAIDYGEDDDLETLFARIEVAIDDAGEESADLLGQSYGGWIAQCFARRHPHRVRRLVLSHSFALSPRDAWRFRLSGKLFSLLPESLVRRLLSRRVRMALRPIGARSSDLHRRQLAALEALLDSRSFLRRLQAQQKCMWQSLQPPICGLPAPTAAVMIIESDNDALVDPKARAALRALYPAAALLSFEQAGHFSAIVETERYVQAVEDFLQPPAESG